jgi:hypothetical protein
MVPNKHLINLMSPATRVAEEIIGQRPITTEFIKFTLEDDFFPWIIPKAAT